MEGERCREQEVMAGCYVWDFFSLNHFCFGSSSLFECQSPAQVALRVSSRLERMSCAAPFSHPEQGSGLDGVSKATTAGQNEP